MFNKSTPAKTPTLRVTTYEGSIDVDASGQHSIIYQPKPRVRPTIKAIIDDEATRLIGADGAFVAYKFVSIR